MGVIPKNKVRFDEDGLPIPEKVKVPKVQFDSDGLPIPLKKKRSSKVWIGFVGSFFSKCCKCCKRWWKSWEFQSPIRKRKSP